MSIISRISYSSMKASFLFPLVNMFKYIKVRRKLYYYNILIIYDNCLITFDNIMIILNNIMITFDTNCVNRKKRKTYEIH